jgi:cell division septation protein DedD
MSALHDSFPRAAPLVCAALFFFALVISSAAHAQQAGPATDTAFLRAQQLVAEGNGEAGRAIVAGRLQAARPGSAEYVEALFWRAALAATAAEAEVDYRRIIVEHPTNRRVEDALIRMAQLELARGRHIEAQRHLERLVREYPNSPARARTHYWLARVLFDENQLARACASMANARASSTAADVELRNQIEYHGQRCEGVDTSATAAAAPEPARAAPPPARPQQQPPPARPQPQAQPRDAPGPARAEWTVQVAAVATRQAAIELQERVRARGYDARVVQVGNLWRVRVGRYATRSEAATVSERMRSQQIDNFITEAEPR